MPDGAIQVTFEELRELVVENRLDIFEAQKSKLMARHSVYVPISIVDKLLAAILERDQQIGRMV